MKNSGALSCVQCLRIYIVGGLYVANVTLPKGVEVDPGKDHEHIMTRFYELLSTLESTTENLL